MHVQSTPLHRNQSEIVTNTSHFNAETVTVEHSADALKHDYSSANDEVNKGTDLNDNLLPKPSSNFQKKTSPDPEASDLSSPHSDPNKCTPSQIALTDLPESFCKSATIILMI